MALTLEELKNKKKRTRKSVRLITDQSVADEYQEAVRNLQRAQVAARSGKNQRQTGSVTAAEKKMKEAEARLDEASIEFVFESVGHKRYEEIMREHRLTDEDRTSMRDRGIPVSDEITWNPETFPIALVCESLVSPELTKAEIYEWLTSDDWNPSEIGELFNAAIEANVRRNVVDMGKG